MKDLVQIFKILNICADCVESCPVYEQPILEMLKLCSLPFLLEKASDELLYKQIVVESISQLGKSFLLFSLTFVLFIYFLLKKNMFID